MRKLPAAAQEERRRQVVGLRQRGVAYRAIAEQVGLSRTGVFDICQRFAAEGAKGLVGKPRGRKPDKQRLLDAAQEAEVQGLVRRHTPDELGLPFALWSRAAVAMLIARRCGVELAVRTVGKHLARWGFTAQKPVRRAHEQDPPGGGAALAQAGLPGHRGASQAGPGRRLLGRRDRLALG
jgi:transposase